MTKNEIITVLRALLRDEVDFQAEVAEDADFLEAGLDSLDFMNLLFAAEERFGIKIADEDIEEHQLTRMDKLTEYLAARAG